MPPQLEPKLAQIGAEADRFLDWFCSQPGIRRPLVDRQLLGRLFLAFHFARGIERFPVGTRAGTTTLLQAFVEYHDDHKFLVIDRYPREWPQSAGRVRCIHWRTRPARIRINPDFILIDSPLSVSEMQDRQSLFEFRNRCHDLAQLAPGAFPDSIMD